MYESLSNASISSAVVPSSGIEHPHPIPSARRSIPSIPASVSISTNPHSTFPSVAFIAGHGTSAPRNASSAAGHSSSEQHRPQWLHGAVYFGLGSNSPNMALNLAPFGRWTPGDKPARSRLALRYASTRAKYAQCSFSSSLREICPPQGSCAFRPIQYIEAGSCGIFHGYLQRPSPDGWSFPASVRFHLACLQFRQFFISHPPMHILSFQRRLRQKAAHPR